jgi:glycosyltransferase involved in cell wall biosynthesis
MQITFILPGSAHNPIGGFKVVFEYANTLINLGHKVTILLLANCSIDGNFKNKIIRNGYFLYRLSSQSYLPNKWFYINPEIDVHWLPSLSNKSIPDADVIIATSWQTAVLVNGIPSKKGEKYYLIQHIEDWSGDYNKVLSTWKLPLRKIVISKWLQYAAQQAGEDSVYIPNGLDFTAFNIDKPIIERENNNVMMLYHKEKWKGSNDGIAALEIVKKEMPDVTVNLYGVFPQPKIPRWIRYTKSPSQKHLRDLYNRSSIFISPSWAEGFPLPPCEAMMCGAALVATDIGGHREMAFDNVTALLSPAHSPDYMADRIMYLLNHPDTRHSIASAAYKYVQRFTWEKSTEKLLSYLSTHH